MFDRNGGLIMKNNNEKQTTITVDEKDILIIGETKFECNTCNGVFIVRKGIFNYCPRCGRKIV